MVNFRKIKTCNNNLNLTFVCCYEIIPTYLRNEEIIVAQNENQHISDSSTNAVEDHANTVQMLADAKKEIADLKMQIAWLERSYE